MNHSVIYGSAVVALVASAGMAQTVSMDNGVVGDGHLRIDTDAYGSYTNWSWGENLDYYDPAGALDELTPTFAGMFMLYEGGDERVAFGEPFKDIDNTYNMNGTYPGTFDLPAQVVGPVLNAAGDGATSSWSQGNYNGDISFHFALAQTVSVGSGADALLRQELSITNAGSSAVDVTIHRQLDLDLPWDGIAEDVAGSVNCFGTIQPYMREPDGDRNSPSLISLTSPDPFAYVSAKSGFSNRGGGLPGRPGFAIWGDFGFPIGWRNYTAGIGEAPVVGELMGPRPAGSLPDYGAFMDIEWTLHLEPGETKTITAVTQYGTDCVDVSCPCACNVDTSTGPDVCDILDFLAFQNAFVGGDSCACNIDTSTGHDVCDIFDFLAFQNEFVGGCP